jgi:sigma-E factor negative regulatory protein RseA
VKWFVGGEANMNTKKITREQVSALADGALDPVSAGTALESLGDKSSRDDWELYHRIGDVLRSEELAAPLSTDFAARMAARLEAEAPHGTALPSEPEEIVAPVWAGGMLAVIKRYLLPGMAGTVALAAAVMMAPQWMMGAPDSSDMSLAAQVPQKEVTHAAVIPAAAPKNVGSNVATTAVVSKSQILVSENDIVRDPRIDQYLMAHQRFSPSAHSSSQFARSATLAAETDK